jgi:hypothetical protein
MICFIIQAGLREAVAAVPAVVAVAAVPAEEAMKAGELYQQ